ncbi:MAG: FAD-dependent oxidoreductase, partial [Anaerolineales bacterium]|nr:FAD-dependent oxidoreductase [Anaerolineales bacterium]
DDGGTSICEPLGAKIKELGGRIELGMKVTRVARDGDEWLVARESTSGEETLRATQIILATDSNNAKKILRSSFGGETENLFFPRALSNAIVRLWFDAKPRKMPEAGIFTGDFMLHNFFWLDRIYNPYRRWSRETGGSALEAHIYGPPETLALPDAILFTKAITEVQQTFPELRGHLIKQHLQRNAEAHTLPSVGAKEKYLGIETPWENLFCAGDWVRHPMPSFFLERACATGIEAANAALEKRGMEKWKLIEYLPPEPFVAWIQKLMVKGRKARRKRMASGGREL